MASEVALLGFPHGGENKVYGPVNHAPTAGTAWQMSMATATANLFDSRIDEDVTLPTARHWVCVEWQIILVVGQDSDGDEFVIWAENATGAGCVSASSLRVRAQERTRATIAIARATRIRTLRNTRTLFA